MSVNLYNIIVIVVDKYQECVSVNLYNIIVIVVDKYQSACLLIYII